MTLVNIPRLDLLHYTQGNSEQRNKFVQDIGKAFNETGFVTIANHGLSTELIEGLYTNVKNFFELPQPEVFDVIKVPGFRYFSTFSNTIFLISNRSTTTSITQST